MVTAVAKVVKTRAGTGRRAGQQTQVQAPGQRPTSGDAEPRVESVRARIRAWVREQADGREELNLSELADGLLERLMQDPEALRAYLRPGLMEDVRAVLHNLRGFILMGPNTAATPEAITRRGASLTRRWASWYEHVGERHISLLSMTRTDLLAAAAERRQRAAVEMGIADFLVGLASQLPEGEEGTGGEKTVGECLTAEQVQQVWQVLYDREEKA